jgi:hypothetical protein
MWGELSKKKKKRKVSWKRRRRKLRWRKRLSRRRRSFWSMTLQRIKKRKLK